MQKSLSEIREIITRSQRALVISHIMPDGDTVGSALGLAYALRKRGLDVRLSCADPLPAELRFLPGSDAFTPRQWVDEDVILVLDASDRERIGSIYDPAAFRTVPVVNIDHHITNLRYGTVNLVVPTAATAEIILMLVTYLGIPLDVTIATCLLGGVVTDTQCFRTSNTTVETLRAAVTLAEAGASLPAISDAVYGHRPLSVLKLWGPVLSAARLEGGILWAEVPLALVGSVGGDDSASKGLVNYLATFDEARVAVLLREMDGNKVDVSLRSRPGIDVAAVALALGGGGHPQAAGCMVEGKLVEVRERILAALRLAVTERVG